MATVPIDPDSNPLPTADEVFASVPDSFVRPTSTLDHVSLAGYAVGHLQSRDVPGSVVAQVGQAFTVLVGQVLVRQRFQVRQIGGADPQTLAHTQPQVVLDHETVPDHTLLDRSIALGELLDEVAGESVTLPRLHKHVALAGLLVVVRALNAFTGEPTTDLGPLIVAGGILTFLEPVGERRFVIDVWALARGVLVVGQIGRASCRESGEGA